MRFEGRSQQGLPVAQIRGGAGAKTQKKRANTISMDWALVTGRESRFAGETTYPGFQLEAAEPRLGAGSSL